MTTLSIIIPIYNEEGALKNTIDRIKKIKNKLDYEVEIIAVNDGCKDNSLKILKSIPDIVIVSHPYNLGYGASLKDGIRKAKGDWIAITDADGTYPIEDIPKLLQHIPEYDMVVGARTGKEVYVPLLRRPAKWFIGKLANFMAARKIEDINSGLRVFNRQKALEFIKLYPSGFSFTTTITLAFMTSDYTVKYLPINYYKRTGTSTIKPLKDFVGFVLLIFRIIIYFKPLKFFLFPGILLILGGISYGTYQVMHFASGIGEFPVLIVILGFLTVLSGFLADIVAKK